MKVLMIGMDGGHAEAYQRGWTPFLESLINKGDLADISEDLISRGWTEIVTGEHASVTGAVYDRPALNGTHEWSLSFKLEDIPGMETKIRTLWDKLCEHGYRVGIMNVPTAFPAPVVNGFFVSGGGGGGPVLQAPTEELCFPRDIHGYLLDMGYIVDERLGTMLAEKKLYDPDAFFGRYIEKNEKRTQAFTDLAKQFEIDFGFVVYKSSSNIAEFLLLPELASAHAENRNPEDTAMVKAIKTYYQAFDEQIKQLHRNFPDVELLFVSDHGMVAREWSFNPNSLLQEVGLQSASKKNRSKMEIINFAKKLIPYSLRVAIRYNKRVKKVVESLVAFDSKNTRAFSTLIGDWRHGIYVNDQARFGGPVSPGDIERVKAEIVERIMAHPGAQRHGVMAAPRPNPNGSPHFPDVVLSVPDGYISSNDYDAPFTQFQLPPGPHEIATVTKGQLLSGKASNALALCVGGGWEVIPGVRDLTMVHHHVLKRFSIWS